MSWGHLILHWKSGTSRNRQAEQKAQQFGSALLMPRGSVLGRARRGASLRQIIADKRYWIVSVANLTYRMRQLELLDEYEYRQRFREIGRRNYRTVEPRPAPRETSQVLDKVFGMLREDGIGPAQVAKELSIYSHELSKLVFDLVTTPMAVPLISSGEFNHLSSAHIESPLANRATLSVLDGGQLHPDSPQPAEMSGHFRATSPAPTEARRSHANHRPKRQSRRRQLPHITCDP